MLANQLAEAIRCAPLRTLDDLSRDIWRAMAAGMLSDEDAQRLAEAVEVRRSAQRCAEAPHHSKPSGGTLGRPWTYFPPKRPQRSPDRARSVERRRTLAASAPMPPTLACRFTTGEVAALAVVAAEHGTVGRCILTIPEIAARAGVSATTVRNAVREAARLGLLTVQERRQHCAPNLPNVVRLISREWVAWIARRLKRKGGCKNPKPTDSQGFRASEKSQADLSRQTQCHPRIAVRDTGQSHARRHTN